MTLEIDTTSLEDTQKLGKRLGQNLRGGEVIELISDLGGGKTAIAKAIAVGIGSQDVAGSPSFTLERVYIGTKVTMHHFDFYRLSEGGIVGQELAEAIAMKDSVVVVEWGDIVKNILGLKTITCQITVTGDSSRRFSFSCSPEYSYLFEGAI